MDLSTGNFVKLFPVESVLNLKWENYFQTDLRRNIIWMLMMIVLQHFIKYIQFVQIFLVMKMIKFQKLEYLLKIIISYLDYIILCKTYLNFVYYMKEEVFISILICQCLNQEKRQEKYKTILLKDLTLLENYFLIIKVSIIIEQQEYIVKLHGLI